MLLKEKKCIPYNENEKKLTHDEKQALLKLISPEWTLTHDETRLFRDFKFKNFKLALDFANTVGLIAEAEKHHPELHVGWKHCGVEIWTHVANSIFESDFILAAKTDSSYQT